FEPPQPRLRRTSCCARRRPGVLKRFSRPCYTTRMRACSWSVLMTGMAVLAMDACRGGESTTATPPSIATATPTATPTVAADRDGGVRTSAATLVPIPDGAPGIGFDDL